MLSYTLKIQKYLCMLLFYDGFFKLVVVNLVIVLISSIKTQIWLHVLENYTKKYIC